jgi:hypothetical protein
MSLGRTRQATVPGLPNERFFPICGIASLEPESMAALWSRRSCSPPP